MAQTFLPLFLIAHRIADRARDLGGQFLSGAVPRGLRRLLRRFILVSDGFHAVPQHLTLPRGRTDAALVQVRKLPENCRNSST